MSGVQRKIPRLPDGDFRFVALDVETACGASGSVCQIGLACVDAGGGITTWVSYVDPQMPFAPFNTTLHGISAQTVAAAPTFPQIWPHLLPLLVRHTLVQHSRFDERALAAACGVHGLPRATLDWVDSVTLARRAWPEFRGEGGHGLAHLKRALALDFRHHDAGEDARAAAQVVLHAEARMNTRFEDLYPRQTGPQTCLPV